MTPEEQRIAIALNLNWRFVKQVGMSPHNLWWLEPPVQWQKYTEAFQQSNVTISRPKDWSGNIFGGSLPDYLNDLNAMHEAENTLLIDSAQMARFGSWLCLLVLHQTAAPDITLANSKLMLVAHATAAQRAEAFLTAIGKWKD